VAWSSRECPNSISRYDLSSTLAIHERKGGVHSSPVRSERGGRSECPTDHDDTEILAPFAPLSSKRVWQNAQVLLADEILASGSRTVGSALRATGLDQEKNHHRYHRVLSRAIWSSREVSRLLLRLLLPP